MKNDPKSLFGLGALAIGVNVLLMLIKITVGWIGHSYALIADGIESASDIFSSLITWAGFHYSLKPADSNHPYGHGKFESLAGIFSGCSLLAAGFFIAYHSIHELITPHHAPAWFTLPVLVFVVVIKELLSRKVLNASETVGSQALKGDAWHHRADAITSGAVAIGISIALIGGPGYEGADDWAALVACLLIVTNGILILKSALHDLMDGTLDDATSRWVEEKSQSVAGVIDVEKVRIRKSGIGLHADLHVRVLHSLSISEGHRISHDVKRTLMEGDPRLKDIIIHIEPALFPAADSSA